MRVRLVIVMMIVTVVVVRFQMNIKLRARDAAFLSPAYMQMVTVQVQFFQGVLQFVGIQPKVKQSADEHIATDSAE